VAVIDVVLEFVVVLDAEVVEDVTVLVDKGVRF
jgi:hypothetical protein